MQQPPAHEVASQTHWPVLLSHSWSDGHTMQLAPALPHEPSDSAAYASHVPLVPPLQQPFGHVVESHEHIPELVSHSPFAQDAHAAPPAPHWDADSDE